MDLIAKNVEEVRIHNRMQTSSDVSPTLVQHNCSSLKGFRGNDRNDLPPDHKGPQ